MKKIITALIIAGLTYNNANAQLKQGLCVRSSGKVCKMSPDKKDKSCYSTKYDQNYQVCSNEYGYYICCEHPAEKPQAYKTTYSDQQASVQRSGTNTENDADSKTDLMNNNEAVQTPNELIAPQSQSYPKNTDYGINQASSYEGYYPKRGRIKVCYYGNNVAENSRMPYQGCASPQYDGPDKNQERNINANTPSDMPPLNGWSKGK